MLLPRTVITMVIIPIAVHSIAITSFIWSSACGMKRLSYRHTKRRIPCKLLRDSPLHVQYMNLRYFCFVSSRNFWRSVFSLLLIVIPSAASGPRNGYHIIVLRDGLASLITSRACYDRRSAFCPFNHRETSRIPGPAAADQLQLVATAHCLFACSASLPAPSRAVSTWSCH